MNLDSEKFIPGTSSSGYLMETSRGGYTYMPCYSSPDQFINGGIILRGKNLKLEDEINRNLGKSIELILAVENEG